MAVFIGAMHVTCAAIWALTGPRAVDDLIGVNPIVMSEEKQEVGRDNDKIKMRDCKRQVISDCHVLASGAPVPAAVPEQ